MSSIDPASLRAAALDALGPLGPSEAHDVLTSAAITCDPDVTRWEGTVGIVRAHRVILGLDPALLARTLASPAAQDALHAAIASAVARAPREALGELRFVWRASVVETESPYRGSAPAIERQEDPTRALAAFLRALGEHPAAAIASSAAIVVTERRARRLVTLQIPKEHRAALESTPARATALIAAAAAIHAGAVGEAPEVRLSYAR